jgi:membrane protease YdiL (CAAX protease family)
MTDQTSAKGGKPATVAIQLLIILALCAVLFPAISPGAAVTGDLSTKLMFLGRMVVLLICATLFLRLRGLRWADLGLRRPRWLRLVLSVVGGLVLVAATAFGVSQGLAHFGIARGDYSMFAPIRGDLEQYLFWLLPVSWGSAALGEELMFRGFVRDALERLFGGRGWLATLAAIVVQAGLFGALHLYQGIGGATTAGMIGLALGFVWWASGRNLWAGIIIHGIVDSGAMTALYLGAMPH